MKHTNPDTTRENMNQNIDKKEKELYTGKLNKQSTFSLCMLPHGLAVAV